MSNSLFRKKSLDKIVQDCKDGVSDGHGGGGLNKVLNVRDLTFMGIAAIVGAGIFSTIGVASFDGGPGISLLFILTAITCGFSALCYAEFASRVPIAGSAYTYAYVSFGEIIAWIIGWALIMEYALGAATVSIAWSEYLNQLFGGTIPYEWCHSPLEHIRQVTGAAINQFPADLVAKAKDHILLLSDLQYNGLSAELKALVHSSYGIINLPALLILLLISLLLIKGTAESAFVNAIIVFIKVAIVLVFIAVGWHFINPANHTPYTIPADAPGHEGFFKHGLGGILGGAAIVFFAFIGFDAVSTAAQEAKNPKKDMPIGILGSLVVCTILYVLFSYVLTGVANWKDFELAGKEASVSYAIKTYMVGYKWLATAVNVAILAGFSSVILVMLLGQSRVFYTMSTDGLLPKIFSDLHPKFRTPYKSNMLLFLFVGLFAAFVPGSIAGDLTSFGTLFAFVLVSAGVLVMRKSDPNAERPFRTPLVPLVPILGVLVCLGMIVALDLHTLTAAFVWMIIGLVVYFAYSKQNSKLKDL